MELSQKNSGRPFVTFIPAELHENKTWEVVYYVMHPVTNKLCRKRNRVKPLKSISNRRKLAKRMVLTINSRLESGWNPFYETKGSREFVKLIDVCRIYINRVQADFNDQTLRKDTYKTYKTNINQLINYITEVIKDDNFLCYKFDAEFIGNYLDHIRYIKNRSARTRDNHLSFLGTFSNFLISKKYISVNPTTTFKKINRSEKTRVLISEGLRKKIFNFFKEHNVSFLTLCMTCYYCLVRRTELTKIKVSDVSLKNQTLFINASDSKNRKSAHVTIPDELMHLLSDHIKNANSNDFLFSRDKFKTGSEQLNPDRVTREWSKMRTKLNIKKNVHWYSLKDSGITDLLMAKVPMLSVKNQARHHSSAQTDSYTPKSMRKSDLNIKESHVKF